MERQKQREGQRWRDRNRERKRERERDRETDRDDLNILIACFISPAPHLLFAQAYFMLLKLIKRKTSFEVWRKKKVFPSYFVYLEKNSS